MIKLQIETTTVEELDVVMARYAPEIKAAGQRLVVPAKAVELSSPSGDARGDPRLGLDSAKAVELSSPSGDTPPPAKAPEEEAEKPKRARGPNKPKAPEKESAELDLTTAPPEVTTEEVRYALSNLTAKRGIEVARELLVNRFHAKNLGMLPADQYGPFVQAANEEANKEANAGE